MAARPPKWLILTGAAVLVVGVAILGPRLFGPRRARHADTGDAADYPVPAYGTRDLEPALNPGVFQPAPPRRDGE